MSADTPEISLTDTEFRKKIVSAYQSGGVKTPRRFWLRGIFSDGTRYLVENGARGIDFYLVTDLTAPERRVGQSSLTIALGAAQGTLTQSLTPPLADPVLSNYRLLSGVDATVFGISLSLVLASVSSLNIRVQRPFGGVSNSPTGL